MLLGAESKASDLTSRARSGFALVFVIPGRLLRFFVGVGPSLSRLDDDDGRLLFFLVSRFVLAVTDWPQVWQARDSPPRG